MEISVKVINLVNKIDEIDTAINDVNKSIEEQTTEQKVVSLKDDMEIIDLSRDIDERISELNRFFGYNAQYESRFVAVRDNYIKTHTKPEKDEPSELPQNDPNAPVQLTQEQVTPTQESVITQTRPISQPSITPAEVLKPKA